MAKDVWFASLSSTLVTSQINLSQVIESIKFLEVTIAKGQDPPRVSSKRTLVTYVNPFGFSFEVVRATVNVTLGYRGQNVAQVRRWASNIFYR